MILRVSSGSGAPALAAGDLLIDTTTANADNLKVGSVVPVKFATIGTTTASDRRDLRTERPARPLPGRGAASSSTHFAQPAASGRARAHDERVTGHHGCHHHGLSGYPGLKIQTRAQFIQS